MFNPDLNLGLNSVHLKDWMHPEWANGFNNRQKKFIFQACLPLTGLSFLVLALPHFLLSVGQGCYQATW